MLRRLQLWNTLQDRRILRGRMQMVKLHLHQDSQCSGGGGIFGPPPVPGPPDGGGPPEGYSPGQAPAGAPNGDGPSESASPPSGDGIFRWRWTFNY
ncbi:Hypothetical predicted protein [Olea europaea subsp. europaea]|uniref:Uncharacterized protein n=1 Tax=Olea europaea subsp. europaea TaxID=158383 RepID=A0A8S0RQS4_OLEEU|nr:Hypothetical predicted protein [Olea europaea subsp. europaea]